MAIQGMTDCHRGSRVCSKAKHRKKSARWSIQTNTGNGTRRRQMHSTNSDHTQGQHSIASNKYPKTKSTRPANKTHLIPDEAYASQWSPTNVRLCIRNTDMRAILGANAEGEAEEKLESCTQGEGLWAYMHVLMHGSH